MFRVGVAGFLAEAKLAYGRPSQTKGDTREMARQVYLHVTGVEPVGDEGEFQVDVILENGQRLPAGTDLDDFHFVLSEIKTRLSSFLATMRYEWLPNDLQSAIEYCLDWFDSDENWKTVQTKASVLLDTGKLFV